MSYPLTWNQQYNVSISVEILGLTSHSPLTDRDIRPFARLAYCSHPITKENIFVKKVHLWHEHSMFMNKNYKSIGHWLKVW